MLDPIKPEIEKIKKATTRLRENIKAEYPQWIMPEQKTSIETKGMDSNYARKSVIAMWNALLEAEEVLDWALKNESTGLFKLMLSGSEIKETYKTMRKQLKLLSPELLPYVRDKDTQKLAEMLVLYLNETQGFLDDIYLSKDELLAAALRNSEKYQKTPKEHSDMLTKRIADSNTKQVLKNLLGFQNRIIKIENIYKLNPNEFTQLCDIMEWKPEEAQQWKIDLKVSEKLNMSTARSSPTAFITLYLLSLTESTPITSSIIKAATDPVKMSLITAIKKITAIASLYLQTHTQSTPVANSLLTAVVTPLIKLVGPTAEETHKKLQRAINRRIVKVIQKMVQEYMAPLEESIAIHSRSPRFSLASKSMQKRVELSKLYSLSLKILRPANLSVEDALLSLIELKQTLEDSQKILDTINRSRSTRDQNAMQVLEKIRRQLDDALDAVSLDEPKPRDALRK